MNLDLLKLVDHPLWYRVTVAIYVAGGIALGVLGMFIKTSTKPTLAAPATAAATTSGTQSPAIVGDNATVNYGATPEVKK